MNIIISILIASVAFYLGAKLLEGVQIKSFFQAIIVALVVGLLDATLGNILKFMTLGLLSLGIFKWILNAVLIVIADYFLSGFKVKNFWWALGLAAIVSICHSILGSIFL